jgi:predicted Zn-dependent protease with MMP-like domain
LAAWLEPIESAAILVIIKTLQSGCSEDWQSSMSLLEAIGELKTKWNHICKGRPNGMVFLFWCYNQNMQTINRAEFEKIVEAGIAAIPEKFLQKLDNVVIMVESEPTPEQAQKLHLHAGWTLFGLYEGVPQAARGDHYTSVVPDKITIFQKPIEAAAHSQAEMKKMVMQTVWHEIAHHFGMNEEEVRHAEQKRKKAE